MAAEIGHGPFGKEPWPWDFVLSPSLELGSQKIAKTRLEGCPWDCQLFMLPVQTLEKKETISVHSISRYGAPSVFFFQIYLF